jgi:hypothetical protein
MLALNNILRTATVVCCLQGMAEPPEKKEKVCHSCGLDDQGQSTLLDAEGARAAFAALPENLWTLEDKRLTRKFTAKNFLQAVAFVNAVAPRAEINRGDPHEVPTPSCPSFEVHAGRAGRRGRAAPPRHPPDEL